MQYKYQIYNLNQYFQEMKFIVYSNQASLDTYQTRFEDFECKQTLAPRIRKNLKYISI